MSKKQITSSKKRVKPDNLTQKEFDCLELFIKYGEKKRAAEEAGYSKKSASSAASRLINSPKGQAYLAKRYDEQNQDKIADADEVMEYLTAVMRGEVNDQFNLDPPLSERTRAANELAKRLIDNNSNNNITAVQIINNIPDVGGRAGRKTTKKKPRKSRIRKTSKVIPANAKVISSTQKEKKNPAAQGEDKKESKPKRRRIIVS